MTNANTVADQFCAWLAERVTGAQLSELYQMYPLIDDFCMSRKVTDRPLLTIVDIQKIKRARDTVERNKIFRFMHRGKTVKISAAIRYYLDFVTANIDFLAADDGDRHAVAAAAPGAATLVADVVNSHIDYIDNRNKGGCLWILGGLEMQGFVDSCAAKGARFHYSQRGCRASKENPAWWTTDEYDTAEKPVQNEPVQNMEEEAARPQLQSGAISTECTPVIEHEREKQGIELVDFNSETDYTDTSPTSCAYFGEQLHVSSWQEAYCKVLKWLSADYDLRGLRGRTANQGKRLLWGSKSQITRMKRAFVFGQNDFYADVGFGNNTIVKLISILLKYCRIDCENIIITYTKDKIDTKDKTESISTAEAPAAVEAAAAEKPESVVESGETDVVRQNKNRFFEWLKANSGAGASYLMTYASVRKIEGYLEASGNANSSLYASKDTEEMLNLSRRLVIDSAFMKLDRDNRGALVEALQLYVDYIKEQMPAKADTSDPEKEECSADIRESTGGFADRYAAILKTNFPDGFRYDRAIDRNRFRMYYSEAYSEDIIDSNEQLIERLLKIGTERNGRIFVRDAAEQKDLIREIDDTIVRTFESGASCIYIDCLYKRFQRELSERLHIYDAEAFESVLLGRADQQYCKKYYYLCRHGCDANPQRDVLSYMKLHHVPVTYDEIAGDIWYIPLDRIKQILVTAIETVNAAAEAYLYAPNLPINEDELKIIAAHVRAALLQRPYISDVELKQLIDEYCPSVALNTAEYPLWGLRNVLGYLLRDEFSFRGAIISKKGEEISMAEVFSDFCRRNDHLTVDALKSFAGELDTVIYWDSVYEEMIRINQNEFIRKDQLTFDVGRIDPVLEMLISEEYLPLKSITLFLHFPTIGVSWNSFVLESYVANYSRKYALLHAGFSATDCCGAIVRRDSKITDYRALIVDVLANDKGWKTKADALELLVKESYQRRRSYSDIENVMQEARNRQYRSKELIIN